MRKTFLGSHIGISQTSHYYPDFNQDLDLNIRLIQMCDKLLKSMDDGKLNCLVFLDVSDLVDKINIDLKNIRKWMLKKLQLHPSKWKYMIIGSS